MTRRPDLFGAWFEAPVPAESQDPRFEMRRLRPEEYECFYDLVDECFGKKRPRAEYEWMYRSNPSGLARCWAAIECATGEMISGQAQFPWPIQRGTEAMLGVFGGDSVTKPRWQRQGIGELRRHVSRAHPWRQRTVTIGGPNEKSMGQFKKDGREHVIQGPIPSAAVLFETREALERLGSPPALARPASVIADAVLAGWRKLALSGRSNLRVAEVRCFDGDFDAVTDRCQAWDKWWCRHDADFLNWRYLHHPTYTYTGLAIAEGDRPVGYAMVRFAGEGATLVDFTADSSDPLQVTTLLRSTIELARAGGSPHLAFFAPAAWRHWGAFRRVGFLPYPAKNYVVALGGDYEPEVHQIENWQLLPGDRDFR